MESKTACCTLGQVSHADFRFGIRFRFLKWFLWQHGNNTLEAASLLHHAILLILMQALIAWYQIDSKDPMSASMPFNLRENTHE